MTPITSYSLSTIPLFSRLRDAERVLIAGAGGGFDVYAGLPLYFALLAEKKQAFLANLTFSYLGGTTAAYLAPHLATVTAETRGEDGYFPERRLAEWLARTGNPAEVHALEKVGVAPLRRAYARLIELLAVDTIVLVDGGTDILMRGDEAGLGTPQEDMTSLAAASQLPLRDKLIVCLGFGIDAYHGVCHAQFLENVADLSADGGFLGAFSVLPNMPEGRAFLEAVEYAQKHSAERPSIVNGCIAAAIAGQFGDVQFTARTSGSELFVNPLMGLYFGFDLEAVAKKSLYLHLLEGTETIFEVSARIEAFRRGRTTRPRRAIPH